MKDYIPENPAIQLSSLSNDTRIYQLSKPRNRIFELNVLREIALILNFRRSSRDLAEEVIRRHNGEGVSFSITDAEFAEKIWPSLPEETRSRKFVLAKKNLKEDQQLSEFRFVWIPPRQVVQKNGMYRCVPTKYSPGQYWDVSDALQFQTQKVDLFAMPTSKAQKEKRRLLELILADFGARRIERVKKEKSEKSEKEKSASLPCRCDCASCASCAAKGAAAGGGAGMKPGWERISGETIEAQIQNAMGILFASGQQWMNMSRSLPDFVRKIHAAFDAEELRLRDAVKRHNRNGGLKLVGGQPK
jgi:hypothetical protein